MFFTIGEEHDNADMPFLEPIENVIAVQEHQQVAEFMKDFTSCNLEDKRQKTIADSKQKGTRLLPSVRYQE